MQIQIDSREHKKERERICKQFDTLGIQYFISKLYCGDYQCLDNARLVVDRKKDLQELCGNVTAQHERFKAELVHAQEVGIKIVILCEHGEGIKQLADVAKWDNPRRHIMTTKVINGKRRPYPKYPYATTGTALYKSLVTMHERYDVDFVFCNKKETGKMIASILGGEGYG